MFSRIMLLDTQPQCSVVSTFKAFDTSMDVILPIPETGSVWCADVATVIVRDAVKGTLTNKVPLELSTEDETIVSMVRAGPDHAWVVSAAGTVFVLDIVSLATVRVAATHIAVTSASGTAFVCLVSRQRVIVFTADSAVAHYTMPSTSAMRPLLYIKSSRLLRRRGGAVGRGGAAGLARRLGSGLPDPAGARNSLSRVAWREVGEDLRLARRAIKGVPHDMLQHHLYVPIKIRRVILRECRGVCPKRYVARGACAPCRLGPSRATHHQGCAAPLARAREHWRLFRWGLG